MNDEWPMFQNIRETAKTIKEKFMSKTTQNPERIDIHAQQDTFECCSYWKNETEILNGPIILQTVRTGGRYQYPGTPFKFCPWCGTKRP